jgi:hypothetical protein
VVLDRTLTKPLGNPQPNSVKYFAAAEITELAKDRAWLAKMTNTVSQHWKQKNHRKTARTQNETASEPLMEFTLQGKDRCKVALGSPPIISD